MSVGALARGHTRVGAVRAWVIVPAGCAPIAMIGGWTLAAHRQPAGYSAVHQSISALAADGARDRWIMTLGLALLGVCHLAVAVGLQPAQRSGRMALALGGAATLAVAALPQPRHGSAPAHIVCAGIGFIALTVWPILASRRNGVGLLARPAGITASAVLAALLVFFAATLSGDLLGLGERTLAGAQSLWPLAVVISVLRAQPLSVAKARRRSGSPSSFK